MKNKLVYLAISFILSSACLFGQITISQSDYVSLFSISSMSTSFSDTLAESIDIGQPGGENSWDFTGFTAHLTNNFNYVSPAETPYSDLFPEANVASYLTFVILTDDGSTGTSESWGYFNSNSGVDYGNVSANEVLEAGETMKIETITTHYPALGQYDFPITFNKMWSVNDSSETITLFDGNMALNAVGNGTYNMNADAWGTMIMPSGKAVEALRIREEHISVSYIGGFPIGSTTSTTYLFLSKTGESLSVSAEGENPSNSGVINGTVNWFNDNITSVEKLAVIPTEFELKQNYPNPFNPSTKIEYSINKPSVVELTVYDILGNKVAELVNEFQAIGNYRFNFDGATLSSGIYLVQLSAGDLMEIKKMTLMK